jgi:hypothetical protein
MHMDNFLLALLAQKAQKASADSARHFSEVVLVRC